MDRSKMIPELGNNMQEKLSEKVASKHVKKEKGGIVTMPFIMGNELCERLAIEGLGANVLNYLTGQMNMSITQAANTRTNINGTSSLTPLIGAFIADSFAGRFWTITVATSVYVIGMIGLILSATLPHLRPPPCDANQVCQKASGGQLAVLYLSLLMTSLGAGGIRPCVVAFGADQFNEADPKQRVQSWSYFNWYYCILATSEIVASTVLVYVQDNIGWGWGFGIPAILMFLSLIVFVFGYSMYRILDPSGSPFTRLLQVTVSAFRKRKAKVANSDSLYKNEELDSSISADGMLQLQHTKQFKFFDKAAIVTEKDNIRPFERPNLWRLNTVHRVEELKTIIGVLPLMAAGILAFTSSAQQSTFSLQQANTMNRRLTKSFQIPAASMSIFASIPKMTILALYGRLLVPFMRRFTGLDRGIGILQRIAVGLTFLIFGTIVAAFVEEKRKHVAIASGLENNSKATLPISVFWLVPQYCFFGMSEAFTSVGYTEFFYDQAPESMRSTGSAMFWIAHSAGNYLGTVLVTLVHKYSARPDGLNWLPAHNLNRGNLEDFYWLLTCLQGVNFLFYLFCARYYTFKSFQASNEENGDGSKEEIELGNRTQA